LEDIEATPPRIADPAWKLWFGLLLLIVIAGVAYQVVGVYAEGDESAGSAFRFLVAGDMDVRFALAGFNANATAQQAITAYTQALPWPRAYRRIGITKIALLHQPQAPELELLASKDAIRRIPKSMIPKLKTEAAMWAEAFGPPKISKARACEIVREVRRLNLGPLREVAVAEVLRRSGQTAQAGAAMAGAKHDAHVKVSALLLLGLALVGGGVAGVVIAVMFFSRLGAGVGRPVADGTLPSILLRAFLVFLVGSVAIGGVLGGFVGWMVGGYEDASLAAVVLLEIAAMFAGVALAITYLGACVPDGRGILRDIGLRAISLTQSLKWAVGGYCATLPFLLLALIATQILLRTVLKGMPTPDHPLIPTVESGGALTWIAAILLAVIVAPLVEEIAFRGLLYTALRARMGMWASVMISGTIFAAIHPTIPEQFLLLSVLGCAFAVIRERSGSLVPSMICHGINNGVMFLWLWLIK